MKYRKAHLFVICCSAIIVWSLSPAIGKARVTVVDKPSTSSRASDIEIKIEGTRPEFTAGTGIGVTGEITNKSDLIIYLNEAYLNLKVPPELEGPFSPAYSMWFAYFPTADHGRFNENEYKATIALKPGDTVTAFWLVNPRIVSEMQNIGPPPDIRMDHPSGGPLTFPPPLDRKADPPLQQNKTSPKAGSTDPSTTRVPSLPPLERPPDEILPLQTSLPPFTQTRSYAGPFTAVKNLLDEVFTELNFIFFNPGDYKITVTANYWHHPVPPFDDYRIAVQTKTVRVAAPQSVILFGASLGGLIAYFILPQGRRRLTQSSESKNWVWNSLKEIGGILGAMLLSAIVTILLSRVSESQFLIRVSITDFWGAIAIGFISNYLGYEILKRLIGSDKNSET